MKPTTVLSKYFNTDNDPPGYSKLPPSKFLGELKALTPEEKLELAKLAAVEMNVELD